MRFDEQKLPLPEISDAINTSALQSKLGAVTTTKSNLAPQPFNVVGLAGVSFTYCLLQVPYCQGFTILLVSISYYTA